MKRAGQITAGMIRTKNDTLQFHNIGTIVLNWHHCQNNLNENSLRYEALNIADLETKILINSFLLEN